MSLWFCHGCNKLYGGNQPVCCGKVEYAWINEKPVPVGEPTMVVVEIPPPSCTCGSSAACRLHSPSWVKP